MFSLPARPLARVPIAVQPVNARVPGASARFRHAERTVSIAHTKAHRSPFVIRVGIKPLPTSADMDCASIQLVQSWRRIREVQNWPVLITVFTVCARSIS